MAQTWDAIVIGSGIGGMAAAASLAKVANMRVLVLEKHYERGGMTHVFRRDGASWDVGVHYVNGLDEGTSIRKLFDFLSGGQLGWNKMPDDFEHFVYPGLDFFVPSNQRQYEQRLIKKFPKEETAIRRYFADMDEIMTWMMVNVNKDTPPWPISWLLKMWNRRGEKKATQTTAEYFDAHFKSPELKSLLASQWPDYGLPPAESAFVLHSIVVRSYANGAHFPDGGSSRIARTFEETVEAHGGAVKVCKEVASILTDKNGQVTGVRAMDLSGVEPTEVVYHSPIVISTAGADLTYKKFLPTDGEIGQRTAAARNLIDQLGPSSSAVTLYLRLAKPVSTIGIKGENWWINKTLDHNDLDAQTAAVLAGKPHRVFVSFPSAKSGDDRYHTAEVIAMVKGSAFSEWSQTEHGNRGSDYLDLKERVTQGLLDVAESAIPGLKTLIIYSELSTPLSMKDYTSHPSGAMYGLKGTPERFRSDALSVVSPIPGLYIGGADGWCLGVVGALMGGAMAAGRVLGRFGYFRVMSAASRGKGSDPLPTTSQTASDKKRAVVVSKKALTPLIWQVEFELDEPISAFAPGQFAMLMVAPYEWRSYSIASVEGRRLTLLVSTRTGGDGSIFVTNVKPNTETKIELPFGGFRLQPNNHRKVFIATGTGLAPFLPMFDTLKAAGQLDSAELLFGCRFVKEDITRDVSPLPRTTICVSGEPEAEGVFHGRVTKVVGDLTFDTATTDFYLCGAPAMVRDCRDELARKGATQIFTEVY